MPLRFLDITSGVVTKVWTEMSTHVVNFGTMVVVTKARHNIIGRNEASVRFSTVVKNLIANSITNEWRYYDGILSTHDAA